MIRCLRHMLLVPFLFALLAVPAMAGDVRGFVAWNWAELSSDSSDGRDVEASHFMQTYSLLYEHRGLINQGKAGSWKTALGYEWNSLDLSFNDVDASVDAGKILYEGELIFAPGGLPFRLHAYSYDLASAIPVAGSPGRLLDEGPIYRDLNGAGEERITGLTFWAGIKNGSYLGQYREMLATLPKLLVDYRQTYRRDMDSLRQEHNRLRDLAFVSLNKKDNWFHYRVAEYEDFLDPSNNYEHRAYILGTVDHNLQRQWINLTNWIQLSVDGSLEQDQDAAGLDEDTYRLNFFTRAQRKAWQGSSFVSLERSFDERENLNKKIAVPFFASGDLDPRNKWRLSLIESSEERLAPGESMWNEHLAYANYQIDSLRPSGLLVTPQVAFDMKRGSLDAEGHAARLAVTARTDVRRDLATTWLADYAVTWFRSNANSDDYLEQSLTFGIDHNPSSRLRLGGTQKLTVGFGTYTSESTEYLKPVLSAEVDYTSYSDSDIDGSSWRSQSKAYLELLGSSRWKHRFEVNLDYMDRGGDRKHNFDIGHVATYSSNEWLVTMESHYEDGDNVDVRLPETELERFASSVGLIDRSFSHATSVSYAPSRAWQTRARAEILWADGIIESSGFFVLGQTASYSLYAKSGAKRKLATFEEEFSYEQMFGGDDGSDLWYAELNLASWWYPYRFLSLGARGQFAHYGEAGANAFKYGVSAEVPFEKFTVAVNYDYGKADDGWDYRSNPGVTEHRWEVDVKKTF